MARLPIDVRASVLAWMDALLPAVRSPRAGRGALVAQAAGVMASTVKTARRRYDAFVRLGWRGLVDRRSVPSARRAASADDPRAFAEWIRAISENYGANTRAAHRAILAAWRSGSAIPGYRSSPPASVGGIPAGWSYPNIARIARLSAHERALASVGRAAARPHAAQVIRSRVGLHPGEIYQADDVWHDVQCAMLSRQTEPVRPLELCMIDLFTAHKIACGIKPRLRDESTGRRINLRASEMRFILAHVFCNVGYRPEGCTLMLEHGTASVDSSVAEILSRYSGGKISVATGGVMDAPALLGAWAGQQKGNPRFKAAIESSHRLIHSAARWLPGQTGGNSRESMPEELAGRDREYQALCRALVPALRGISDEEREWMISQLSVPFPAYESYVRIAYELYDIIAHQTDHRLEGWEASGLVVSGFRTSFSSDVFPWSSLDAVSSQEADAIRAMVRLRPELNVVRPMSRAEAWSTARLARLPDAAFCEICGPDLAVERRVRDHAIRFEDSSVQRGRLFSFPAIATDPFGRQILLPDGEHYSTLHSPFDPSVLYILDARFRLVGRLSHQVVASQADMESIHRAMGEAARNEAVALAPYRFRHADRSGSVAAARRRNDAVLSGRVPSPFRSPSAPVPADKAGRVLAGIVAEPDAPEMPSADAQSGLDDIFGPDI